MLFSSGEYRDVVVKTVEVQQGGVELQLSNGERSGTVFILDSEEMCETVKTLKPGELVTIVFGALKESLIRLESIVRQS